MTPPSAAPAMLVRAAVPADIDALEELIAVSARRLGRGYYTDEETEAAIVHLFGVDSELVSDASHLVAEAGGELVGCGGWSRRPTLFGSDRYAARREGVLDPARDAARIRAFFVAPGQARRGVGAALLAACETAARQAGFFRTALMATLPGVPFYAAHRYRADPAVTLDLGGVAVRFVPMARDIVAQAQQSAAS